MPTSPIVSGLLLQFLVGITFLFILSEIPGVSARGKI